ncbi:SLAIN motif-containing protein 1-like [Tachysurus ichikawai]
MQNLAQGYSTSLWSILHALGVPPKIVALFKLLYSAQSCVHINGRDSDWFPITSGVRQGCVAAPDLFNCIIDHLMFRVWDRVPGVSFGSYHLTDLEYADDTILLSTSYSRWLGHVLRLPSDHPMRAILQFDPKAAGWRRPRGKPRTRWLDVLAGDLQQQGVAIEDAEQLAQDHQCWKQLVHLVGSGMGHPPTHRRSQID